MHHCALLGVKVHLPPHSPLMEGVQVVLKGMSVVGSVDGSVKDTVVSEEPCDCARGEVICNVVNVYKEQ